MISSQVVSIHRQYFSLKKIIHGVNVKLLTIVYKRIAELKKILYVNYTYICIAFISNSLLKAKIALKSASSFTLCHLQLSRDFIKNKMFLIRTLSQLNKRYYDCTLINTSIKIAKKVITVHYDDLSRRFLRHFTLIYETEELVCLYAYIQETTTRIYSQSDLYYTSYFIYLFYRRRQQDI